MADYFLEAHIAKSEQEFDGFSERAKSILLEYQYPGNARELRNIVERTAILCPPEMSLIEAEHLDFQANVFQEMPLQSDQSADEAEYDRILGALQENQWHRGRAAKKLGIPYSTPRYKMEKLGLSQIRD